MAGITATGAGAGTIGITGTGAAGNYLTSFRDALFWAQTRNPAPYTSLWIPGSRGRCAPRNDGIRQARDAGLFSFERSCAIKGHEPRLPGEPAMKTWIGAITLMAVL